MELFRDVADKKRKIQEKYPVCLGRYPHQECQKQKRPSRRRWPFFNEIRGQCPP